MRRFLLPAILIALSVTACDGGDAAPTATDPVMCAFPYAAPFGWTKGEEAEVPQGTHIATQAVYERGDRAVVYSAGMLRDQFETAPLRDGLPLADGGTASLFAITEPPGTHGYTLFWYGPQPCKQYVIDGVEGFTSHREFLEAMRDMGVLAGENVSGASP